VASIAALVGAAGSVAFTLYASRRNPSRFLAMLFIGWVLSPFIALAWASLVSKRWPVRTRVWLDGVMLLLALSSLSVYAANALRPLATKGAFIFLVVPLASWLLIAISGWVVLRSTR
jgi:hypothetical protein